MMRSPPLASHGLVKEPIPLELAGQSCCGSGAALAAALADAAADGVASALALALALAAGAWDLVSSLEQPKTAMAIANVTSVRIEIS
jgi:hypothetical protein